MSASVTDRFWGDFRPSQARVWERNVEKNALPPAAHRGERKQSLVYHIRKIGNRGERCKTKLEEKEKKLLGSEKRRSGVSLLWAGGSQGAAGLVYEQKEGKVE